MKTNRTNEISSRLIFILLLSLPLAVLFLLPGGAVINHAWFWIALMFGFLLMWMLIGVPAHDDATVIETRPRMLGENEQHESVRAVMDVEVATEQDGIQAYRGRLRQPADTAYESLVSALPEGNVPLIQEDDRHGQAIFLIPGEGSDALVKPVRPWFHWLLFALTILTTTWAGAAHQGIDLLREPDRFAAGLPYSLGLLAILGVHEMGHYFAARRHGIDVTPPFFIPLPFALGTFGAFIKMRSPSQNRTALFDVAVAGPLAGLVIAIPALLIGLRSSTIPPVVSSCRVDHGLFKQRKRRTPLEKPDRENRDDPVIRLEQTDHF